MVIDISKITIYELIALCLSGTAILIPIIQWVWKKFIVQPELKHYPTGRAYLFTNRSGSYIQFHGVFEALKKPISVKNINLKIVRKKDDKALNLTWSVFVSPVNQQIVGAYASASEIAHPFRIEADSVFCAFIEFADFYESSAQTLNPYFDRLENAMNTSILHNRDYKEAYKKFIELDEYKEAKSAIEKERFWNIGKYEMTLEVEYADKKTHFIYNFDVSNEHVEGLKHNMKETLDSIIKNVYGVRIKSQTVQVQVRNFGN